MFWQSHQRCSFRDALGCKRFIVFSLDRLNMLSFFPSAARAEVCPGAIHGQRGVRPQQHFDTYVDGSLGYQWTPFWLFWWTIHFLGILWGVYPLATRLASPQLVAKVAMVQRLSKVCWFPWFPSPRQHCWLMLAWWLGVWIFWGSVWEKGQSQDGIDWVREWYGYGSIPINTIFSGMNIHLPAILMFTRGTRFWHTAISSCFVIAMWWDGMGIWAKNRSRRKRSHVQEALIVWHHDDTMFFCVWF